MFSDWAVSESKTEDKNKSIFQAILDRTEIIEVEVDQLVHIADPQRGYVGSHPSSTFLASLLEESCVSGVSTGIKTITPRFGVTHSQILVVVGEPVILSQEKMR